MSGIETRIKSTSTDWTGDRCNCLSHKYAAAIAKDWPQIHLRARLDDEWGTDLHWYVDLCTEEIGRFVEWAQRVFKVPMIYNLDDDVPTIEFYDDYRE